MKKEERMYSPDSISMIDCARAPLGQLPSTLRHSCDKFYQAPSFPACNIGESRGAWERGYQITKMLHKLLTINNLLLMED